MPAALHHEGTKITEVAKSLEFGMMFLRLRDLRVFVISLVHTQSAFSQQQC